MIVIDTITGEDAPKWSDLVLRGLLGCHNNVCDLDDLGKWVKYPLRSPIDTFVPISVCHFAPSASGQFSPHRLSFLQHPTTISPSQPRVSKGIEAYLGVVGMRMKKGQRDEFLCTSQIVILHSIFISFRRDRIGSVTDFTAA